MYTYVDWMKCKKCRETNKLFHSINRNYRIIILGKCKDCHILDMRLYRKVNYKKLKEKRREYYHKNKDKLNNLARIFRLNNIEHYRAQARGYAQRKRNNEN